MKTGMCIEESGGQHGPLVRMHELMMQPAVECIRMPFQHCYICNSSIGAAFHCQALVQQDTISNCYRFG